MYMLHDHRYRCIKYITAYLHNSGYMNKYIHTIIYVCIPIYRESEAETEIDRVSPVLHQAECACGVVGAGEKGPEIRALANRRSGDYAEGVGAPSSLPLFGQTLQRLMAIRQ